MEDPLTQDHHIVWESGGQWWTDYPPPPGFDGEESEGEGDGRGYRRTLSPAEQAVVDSDLAGERAVAEAQRDAYFGFVPDADGEPLPLLPATGTAPSSPGAAPPPDPDERPAD